MAVRPTCRQSEGSVLHLGERQERLETRIDGGTEAEAQSATEKGLLEQIMDGLPEIFCLADRKGRFLRWNRRFEEVTEYSPREIAKMTMLDLFHGEDKVAAAKSAEQVFALGGTLAELDLVTKQGRKTRIVFRGFRSVIEGSDYLVMLGIESTERKELSHVIEGSEEKLAAFLKSVTDYMFVLEEDLTIVWAKEMVKGVFGRNLVGRTCYEALRGRSQVCEPCIVKRNFEEGRYLIEYESQLTGTDGTRHDFSIMVSALTWHPNGRPKMFFGICRDITEKKALEAEAMRANQLAALGELAAGVAHEINNPVNGIINYAQILIDRNEEEGERDDIPARIIQEGERVAQIVRKLLCFARKQNDGREPVTVKDILADSLMLVERQIRNDGIDLRVNLCAGLPEIMGNSQQIQQVFLNVLNNARYALNQKFPGRHEDKVLEITARLVPRNGGALIRTAFHDHGTGIPRDILDKICDPFFSTKPRGEGTGLGLSMSYGIVRDHEGSLRVNSVEGKYTEVIIDLPVFKEMRLHA